MELTYTDAGRRDIGLVEAEGDFDCGASEDDFELTWPSNLPLPAFGSVIYRESTDIGGVVRGWDTTGDSPKVTGVTWTGFLSEHVIGPNKGQAYLTLNDTWCSIVSQLVSRAAFGDVVAVAGADGPSFSHTFKGSRDSAQGEAGRYMSCWDAIWQCMLEHGVTVRAVWGGDPVRLTINCDTSTDWSATDELPTDALTVRIKRKSAINHLICLGAGEGAAREVLHLYCDKSGNISTKQSQKGPWEIADTYDYPGSTTLEKDGRKRLKELWQSAQKVDAKIPDGFGLTLDLGDVIGGVDVRTGISAKAVVSRKRTHVPEGTTEYETTLR